MPEQKTFALVAATAAMLALASCETTTTPATPMKQDVEFLRGCWVQKAAPDGPVKSFLRLLPEGADGPDYKGRIQDVGGAGEMITVSDLSFARDGTRLVMVVDGRPPQTLTNHPIDGPGASPIPPGAKRAAFSQLLADGSYNAWAVAEGDGEHLRIYLNERDGRLRGNIFRGERDGCD